MTAAVAAGLMRPRMTDNTAALMPLLPLNPRTAKAMPPQNLDKTGYKVGIFSLAGQGAVE